MNSRRDPGPGRGAPRRFLAGLGILFFLAHPGLAQPGPGHVLALGVGLSEYDPPLAELRAALQAAGGGPLNARPDFRGRVLYLSAARLARGPGSRYTGLELDCVRYLGRSESGDFQLEVERYAGNLLRLTRQDTRTRLQTCYGAGPVLIRLRREGQVQQRLAPLTTRSDWVWGLGSLAGAELLLSSRLALGVRYAYDLMRATSFDGVEYSLAGGALAFYLSWYSP